jgi:hypothetical protein
MAVVILDDAAYVYGLQPLVANLLTIVDLANLEALILIFWMF